MILTGWQISETNLGMSWGRVDIRIEILTHMLRRSLRVTLFLIGCRTLTMRLWILGHKGYGNDTEDRYHLPLIPSSAAAHCIFCSCQFGIVSFVNTLGLRISYNPTSSPCSRIITHDYWDIIASEHWCSDPTDVHDSFLLCYNYRNRLEHMDQSVRNLSLIIRPRLGFLPGCVSGFAEAWYLGWAINIVARIPGLCQSGLSGRFFVFGRVRPWVRMGKAAGESSRIFWIKKTSNRILMIPMRLALAPWQVDSDLLIPSAYTYNRWQGRSGIKRTHVKWLILHVCFILFIYFSSSTWSGGRNED